MKNIYLISLCLILTISTKNIYAFTHHTHYVFASFSMPKDRLKILLYASKKKKIPVIMRGLVNNSFQSTLKKLNDIDPAHQTGFQLNPQLFRHYHIDNVPTFVRDKEDMQTHHHVVRKIVGDVGLARAIDISKRKYMPDSIEEPGNLPNVNFKKSFSELSAVTHAGESMNRSAGDAHLTQMFIGTPDYCRITTLHYRNCCKKNGWGIDTHLSSCRLNEKALAVKRQQNLCVNVGRYCAHKVMGKCTEYHQSFCCFAHPLAKIVQQQGRAQLHQGFGTPLHPNCSGLTPTQLQQLDMQRMDFRSYYKTLTHSIQRPNLDTLTKHIKASVQQTQRKNDL